MKRLIILLTPMFFLAACFKSKDNNDTPPRADEVAGLYIQEVPGINPPVLERAEAYKIANNRYGMRKLSSARFPSFTFVTDTSAGAAFIGAIARTQYYLILPQTSDGVTLTDTGHLSFKIDTKWISFDLRSPTSGNSVFYSARKQ